MLWIFAIVLLAICVGILFFGLRRGGETEGAASDEASRAFFRSQLEGIDSDVASGRMSEDEANAARAELAREVLRHEKENGVLKPQRNGRVVLMAALPVIAVASLGVYAAIGQADLPAQPLADRDLSQLDGQMSLDDAVARVEAQLAETPDDVRGWLVLAPVYMEQGRYGEAANAWRRVIELDQPTPDYQTSLAEALLLDNDGAANQEALDLLRQAAEADPLHVRSRFYLAAELMRTQDYAGAVLMWQELLAIGTGEEAWVPTAREGLAAAQAMAEGESLDQAEPDATMDVMIRGMVEGLAARLADEGGSADEWMQLVRSRQQLDGDEAARDDLERGLAALSGQDRLALEDFAGDLGLIAEQ